MFQIVEVIETDKAFKTNQIDDDGNVLFDGSILVRIGSIHSMLGQVRNVWAAPLNFNKRIPLIGEHVALIEAPSAEATTRSYKGKRFYYFTLVNTVNDLTLQHFHKQWKREANGVGSKNVTEILSDWDEVGYTFSTRPGRTKMLQPFEGDDLWEGRFGQSIRFSRHYSFVNRPGNGIYEKQAIANWPGKSLNDPITIIRNTKPNKGIGYDLEDLSKDSSSIYLTTTQKLLKFKPGFNRNCDAKVTPVWNKGSQIVISSDRAILNAKIDSAFVIGNKKSIVTANKVILQSAKHKVDLDALMTWLKNLAGQLEKLATGQATFTTSMGPTGPASNAAQITKIVKADYQKYFKKFACV